MMSGAAPMGADAADAGDGTDSDATALLVIEITCLRDGTFSVEAETGAQEEGEEGGEASGADDGSEASEGAQPAKTFSEAMDIANQMYESASGDNGASKQAGFDQVFGKGAGAAAGQ
jgi:hypothetical protein